MYLSTGSCVHYAKNPLLHKNIFSMSKAFVDFELFYMLWGIQCFFIYENRVIWIWLDYNWLEDILKWNTAYLKLATDFEQRL